MIGRKNKLNIVPVQPRSAEVKPEAERVEVKAEAESAEVKAEVERAEVKAKKEEKKAAAHDSKKRYRHEYKYMINARQEAILLSKAQGAMQRDPHVREDGTYLIRSVYLDDINDTCLLENLSGCDPRSKFRIRYYNSDIGRISLEKKSKVRSMCLKESCRLTVEECEVLLSGDIPAVTGDMPEEKQRLFTEVRLRGLIPKTIVTYERIPFIYSGGNVRVTFDRKITSSNELNRFLSGDYAERPILPCGESILEVKWDEILPRHLKDVLRLDGLHWIAFSKYFMCRVFHQ